jgi:predicted acetyltransferase
MNEIALELYKETGADPEKGHVPSRHYRIVRLSDHAVVGECSLRLGHNENTFYGGNIGYEVYVPYRGHHYAAQACALLFDIARREGMEQLIITCSPDNIASQRTCERAGAVLVQMIEIPAHHDMYRTGRRVSCQYRVVL